MPALHRHHRHNLLPPSRWSLNPAPHGGSEFRRHDLTEGKACALKGLATRKPMLFGITSVSSTSMAWLDKRWPRMNRWLFGKLSTRSSTHLA